MNLLDVVIYSFSVVVCIQVLFYGFIYGRFAFTKPKVNPQKNHPISVIVWAKNDAEHLTENLPSIINQDYQTFEIVLVNDASHDNTLDIMEDFEEQHNNIKIVNVKNTEAFWANKKYALTLGIKAAKYDHLLFTNANCKPVSKLWIQEMNAHFSETKTIILGYSSYTKIKTSFYNKLIRFDALLYAIQYFSFAKLGIPFSGNGKNLSYTRDAFFNTNGFIKHIDIRIGEDNLFVNDAANSKNTAICFSKDSFTTSKTNFKNWYSEKRRYIQTTSRYKNKHKLLLGLFYGSQILFWALFVFVLFTRYWKLGLILWVIRIITQYISLGISAKKLDELDTLLLLPILEPFLIITQLTIFITNLFSKTTHWN